MSVSLNDVARESGTWCIHGVEQGCESCNRFVQDLVVGLSRGYVSDARKIAHAQISADFKTRPSEVFPEPKKARTSKVNDTEFEEYRKNFLSLIEDEDEPSVPGDWMPQHRRSA